MTPMPNHHPAFRCTRSQNVASLNIQVEEFEHIKTGAQHIHLAADNPENVFLVALRTVPTDSTGVAHILEHTALCGSKKYPVRDPFFMMTRRSLNTFMNAFTSSDWTAYPFASLNRKDFNNLLDVYLDAVFFSRLDPLDFAQEGHRLEFEQPHNPDSALVFKGVVYNEMKGAMSSIPSQLWHTLTKYLYPTSTYHYNSGGDPEQIPDLTYQQLVSFYRSHYHPSNAVFMTFGDIPAQELQAKFEAQVLHDFSRDVHQIAVNNEKRYFAPVRVQESYPFNDKDMDNKTHVVVGWLWGDSTDLQESLEARLLAGVLLDNSASPLLRALETTDLGTAPSPLCGLDDSQKELTFVCGLEGCTEKSADQVEQLIISTLQQLAQQGVPQEDLESALHQLELHQREIGGNSYPYGLQLILTALTAATHRGDPVGLLDIDASLEQLRLAIRDPEFIKNLVHRYLIDNPHYVRLTLQPDQHINARKESAEKLKLASLKTALSDQDKSRILELAESLKKRQDQEDDESLLPKVTLADVPKSESVLEPDISTQGNTKLTSYATGTNGLVYQQIVFDFPTLNDHLLNVLPIYSDSVTEVGIGNRDYLDVQRWRAQISGGINAFSSIRSVTDDIHRTQGFFTFSGKALNRNHGPLLELLNATLDGARFDERERLIDLVSQLRAAREQSVVGSGHALAMLAATSGMCALAQLSHRLSGLAGIKALKKLDNSLKQQSHMDLLIEHLTSLHQHITRMPRQLLLVAEQQMLPEFKQVCLNAMGTRSTNKTAPFDLEKHQSRVHQAWLTTSQVNYCAKAYPTVAMDHPDSAALVVLGGFLRNGFLHKAIREQGGAYGGGASQDNNIGAFQFYSYRDPRLQETLDDFDRALDWLAQRDHPAQKIEEAILGVISSLDRSESPSGKAKRLFHSDLHGRTLQRRQQFRERVLATTQGDLKRVAQKYLIPEYANVAVVSDQSKSPQLQKLNLDVIEL